MKSNIQAAAHRSRPVSLRNTDRTGTYVTECAIVLPVFVVFLAGIMEFSHVYMVRSSLNAAAKEAARLGALDDVTTAMVQARAQEIVTAAISTDVTIQVKDASVFDDANVDPTTIDYGALADVEASTAEPRALIAVRIVVPYDSVALLPPFWAKNLNLYGISVVRHE